jgi:hypothetical protein
MKAVARRSAEEDFTNIAARFVIVIRTSIREPPLREWISRCPGYGD